MIEKMNRNLPTLPAPIYLSKAESLLFNRVGNGLPDRLCLGKQEPVR